MTKAPEYVWIPDEGLYGELISLGAYASLITYKKNNLEYQVMINNDEFEHFGEGIDDDDTD